MRSFLVLLATAAMVIVGCGTSGSSSGSGGSSASNAATSSASGSGMASSTSSVASSSASSSASGAGGMSAQSSGSGVDAGPLGPTVQILHPGSGVDRKVNVSIFFHGTATDPTDGTLSGNALVWTDNLEGQFGTGDPV